MDMSNEEKIKILDVINTFVNEKERDISFIFQSLGWNKEHLKNKAHLRYSCPNNTSHLIGPLKMNEHLEICNMAQFKYNHKDQQLPENSNNDEKTSVKIDQNLSRIILNKAAKNQSNFVRGIDEELKDERPAPLSHSQLISLYTTDERRAIYDYVISKTSNSQPLEQLYLSNNGSESGRETHSTGYIEEQAMLRDMKRRRAKYKVSTKSKSYTEVMKSVIDNLMMSHEEDVKSKVGDKADESYKRKDHGDSNRSSKIHKGYRSKDRDYKFESKHRKSNVKIMYK